MRTSRSAAPAVLLVLLLSSPRSASAAPVTEDLWLHSSITATIAGPIPLRAELNYDDSRADAPIAVVMAGFSPTNGNLDAVRPHARRLRDDGFFAVSVAMRGRDGSAGVRDSGGLEIHDIYDAVEAVKQQYADFVDPTNVHVTGYSGGGGNVMSAIVRFPDYFRVGASFFGMSDYGLDPADGWYNNGAGSRTSILDQDVGDPNTGNPLVLDRYRARASNLAASNSRYVEVHLFVDDDETICPLVNHATFAAYGGAHVTHHVGSSSSPTYQDFNGNGVEDPGERQLWPHGFPTASQQDAAEQWYRDRLLDGSIPEPWIEPSGSFVVPGFLRTRHFEVWPGNGQNAAGVVTYSLGATSASFQVDVTSLDPSVPISLVVLTGFMSPPGALVEARRNGEVVDVFQAGDRRVLYGLASGDVVDLAVVAPAVPAGPGALWSILLCAGPIVATGLRRLP
jgi:dienelactone hydrolase